jgi:hypothetical protein
MANAIMAIAVEDILVLSIVQTVILKNGCNRTAILPVRHDINVLLAPAIVVTGMLFHKLERASKLQI